MNSIGAEQVKIVGIGAVEVKSIGIGAVQVRCTGSIHMQSIGTVEVNIRKQKCFLKFKLSSKNDTNLLCWKWWRVVLTN